MLTRISNPAISIKSLLYLYSKVWATNQSKQAKQYHDRGACSLKNSNCFVLHLSAQPFNQYCSSCFTALSPRGTLRMWQSACGPLSPDVEGVQRCQALFGERVEAPVHAAVRLSCRLLSFCVSHFDASKRTPDKETQSLDAHSCNSICCRLLAVSH